MSKRPIIILSAAIAAVAVVLWSHDVPTALTAEDRAAIATMLEGRDVAAPSAAYEEEVRIIAAVQRAVLDASPVYRSIPTGHEREPADLLREGKGLCFDRSRTIEKALDSLGFEVRHISVYPSLVHLWLPTSAPSHALSEVRTSRGWMLVDSVTPWLGLDADSAPISASRLKDYGSEKLALRDPIPDMIEILQGDFVHVIGLYSRHGGFYPPFTPFPDVNWRQAASNFLS